MKIVNPHYMGSVAAFVAANKATIETYLTQNAHQQEISFDQIRADFPGVKDPATSVAPMTDGTIAEIFQSLGYEVRA